VQNLRKERNLDVADRILLTIEADDDISTALQQFESYIGKETLSNQINYQADPEGVEIACGDYTIKIAIQKE
jgi:isoleucyl-tRNA synthetase